MKKTPLILAASGTTSQALSTYRDIDEQVQRSFAGHPVYWAYSTRGPTQPLRESAVQAPSPPAQVLQDIASAGYRQAVVQSLHLLPGQEFHQLIAECRKSPISCHLGMPALFNYQDYQKLTDCLAPAILSRPEKAILLIGHGSHHPIWAAYLALETIFRRRFGNRIFVGVVEKNPPSESVPAEIVTAGFKQVCIIPLLVVAGMHYNRDVVSASETSWLRRLQRMSLEVESIDYGLGLQPGFNDIFLDHIKDALKRADKQEFPEGTCL